MYNKKIYEYEQSIKPKKKVYMDYKLKYMEDLKYSIQEMLNEFGKEHTDKKMNDLLVKKLDDLYHTMNTLIHFPEYSLPDDKF